MPIVRAKSRRFSEEEDADILAYREWSNGKVSESWSQFCARYGNKFWIDPRSSASLFQRAGRISGQRYQTLSRNKEMMQNMLTIRKSSLWWTWGRIGQAFGTNAKTASRAYKTFLKRHEIDEFENESKRIRWTESEMRRLKRARHLGQSWEQISQRFCHEEYMCIAAHWIHSYVENRPGNLHTPFHPKYFFSMAEKTRISRVPKSSSIHENEDRKREQWGEKGGMERLHSKSDAKNAKSSRRGGSSQLDLSTSQSTKK
ncbi:hypothetical protein MFRU_035g00030 [Monilinia fructicola]|uniref:Myb-like domain-containing protein n=1 Tax=Monilinia fructicola TaxID=38448 RepID=A0A5M9JYE1_MONFR|nr:hypothetical protein EYC84_001721 [Monilinia fructicola]KAG4026851.1 hypothetical protein MFRU_035g00030 [Monilinia fructicola]